MRKALGLLALIVALGVSTYAWEMAHTGSTNFLTLNNWSNLLTWIGLFGILSLGQSLVIITGGIDLSVGSVVGLVGITAAMLLDKGQGLPAPVALGLALLLATAIGLWNGLLITKARMQPFVVTLCGLFLFRGFARLVTSDKTQGFGLAAPNLKWFGRGTLLDLLPQHSMTDPSLLPWYLGLLRAVAAPFLLMLLTGVILAAFLHFSAKGRHLFAMGANEEAAMLSGIRTDRLKISAYVLCSLVTGVGGLLIAFKVNSLGPSDFGNFYELYAIAGAVLGGCSLRGGSGNVLGIVLGSTLIMLLRNLVNILGIPSELEYVVIGGAILFGVFIDEMLTRRHAGKAATA